MNETMRAVVWQGNPYSVGVVDLPKPAIINEMDAIVQMSRAAICGSDLHIYRGTNVGEFPPPPLALVMKELDISPKLAPVLAILISAIRSLSHSLLTRATFTPISPHECMLVTVTAVT